ncbi:MAG TPA: MurR/RpiR family transcriptional regulator [Candidatus Methylomirabilis sp.]|nr:MurR/RpiR family transcriptional regulator [Candidatus Methylomirabilis sp.]
MNQRTVPSLAPTATLAERIDELSYKRQEIIRPILEHPREYVLLSVRAMAKRLRTDPATVVRIVRGLGFATYRDFQRHLHDLSIAFATSLDTMQSSGRATSMPVHVREALEQDLKNLHGLKNSLDAQRLVSLAKRFYDARRIVILAGDLAAILADYLDYQITLLGLPVFTATTAGRIAHLVRTVNQRDLVLAISFRRGLRQTVEGVHLARDRKAYSVGITDTFVSPLARECDEVFLASVESTSFGASYAAPVALVNALLAACGQYRRPQTLAILKEIAEEQRKGFRWYTV